MVKALLSSLAICVLTASSALAESLSPVELEHALLEAVIAGKIDPVDPQERCGYYQNKVNTYCHPDSYNERLCATYTGLMEMWCEIAARGR